MAAIDILRVDYRNFPVKSQIRLARVSFHRKYFFLDMPAEFEYTGQVQLTSTIILGPATFDEEGKRRPP